MICLATRQNKNCHRRNKSAGRHCAQQQNSEFYPNIKNHPLPRTTKPVLQRAVCTLLVTLSETERNPTRIHTRPLNMRFCFQKKTEPSSFLGKNKVQFKATHLDRVLFQKSPVPKFETANVQQQKNDHPTLDTVRESTLRRNTGAYTMRA